MNCFADIKEEQYQQSCPTPLEAFRLTPESKNHSISIAPVFIPFLGASYADLHSYLEVKAFGRNHSFLLDLNYASFKCSDCRYPGKERRYGAGIFYRYSYSNPYYNDIFIQGGLSFVNEYSEETRTKVSNSNDLIVPQAVMGSRQYFGIYFYELGFGIKYRSVETSAGNYPGYKKGVVPVLHFSLGFPFL